MANLWFWLLACLGFAGKHLRGSAPVLDYLNDAVYPLFCLHLPIIVGLAYLIVPLCWLVWTKYGVITTGTIALTLLGYEGVRRAAWLRPFLGLKPRPPANRPLGARVSAPSDE